MLRIKKCLNVACDSFVKHTYKGYEAGYCSDWCKEMIIGQKRLNTIKEKKKSKLIKLNNFMTNAKKIKRNYRTNKKTR